MDRLICFLLAALSVSLSLNLVAQTFRDGLRFGDKWSDDRYEVHGDGTVTDKKFGLMWAQCSVGQDYGADCVGSAERLDFRAAQHGKMVYSVGQYNDWRLPTADELESLAARDRYRPAININIFPNTPSGSFWSDTRTSGGFGKPLNERSARTISFDSGNRGASLSPDTRIYVRYVRGNSSRILR